VASCRRPDPRRRRGREGFTLVEVLVAMVILAIGLLALEAMGIGAARMVARADRESEFTALASDRLERVLNRVDQGQAAQPGVEELPGSVVVQTAVAQTAVAGRTLYTVTVTVTPPPNQSWRLEPVTVVGRAIR
jgi:prepilin-type N-terminal cleavage/methylation domain-containing protein